MPLEWAEAQTNLGNALARLAMRETGTDRLLEAVAIMRLALQELTRERMPLSWAEAQMNLGDALWALGEREKGTRYLQEALEAWDVCLLDYW